MKERERKKRGDDNIIQESSSFFTKGRKVNGKEKVSRKTRE